VSSSRFLTTKEVGRILGISRQRAYELVRQGAIPAVRIGARWRVPASVFEQLEARAYGDLSERHKGEGGDERR